LFASPPDVDISLFRTPLRPILAAIAAEIADQFLFLGVDRDHWLLDLLMGTYDLAANAGWVSLGVDHDTAAFAVNSISTSGGSTSGGRVTPTRPGC
jgi:hypothetical protein